MPAAVTFSEAAKALGFRSRSTLFRLKDAGDLADYLRPPSSPGGAQLLELAPRGLPPLAEHVSRCVRPQITNEARHRRPRIDPRWGTVAGVLTEALADRGGLSLCDAEAQAIAAALPDAVADGFGPDGLEPLRLAVANAGSWLAGPGTPPHPEGTGEFWSEWGQWDPTAPPLSDAELWEHVAQITAGMVRTDGPLTGPQASEIHFQLGEAIAAVMGGARFDPVRWDAASARSLLEDPDVSGGLCPHSLPELQRLAAGGLLPPDLQAAADVALAAYAAQAQASPLPVVVSD